MRMFLPLSLLFCPLVEADMEMWTDKAGHIARMELQSTTTSDDGVTGNFMMEEGTRISVAASRFSEADEKRINEWNDFTKLHVPQFKGVTIPHKESFHSSGEPQAAASLVYGFSFPDSRIVGIRKDGIVIQSCSLTETTALSAIHVYNAVEQQAPALSETAWSLGTCQEYRMSGIEPQRRGLGLNFTLHNGGGFGDEQTRKSSFKAEVVVAASNNLKIATLKFSDKDCLSGDRLIPPGGAPPTNEQVVRSVGPIKVWLEEQFDTPSTDGPGIGAKHIVVRTDEPYLPGSVRSALVFSNGAPITRLSEARAAGITVKLECWTDFKEMKLLCEKKPSDSGA